MEFVLIDFENVQPQDLALLIGGPYKIKIFLGKTQTKMPVATARALHAFGADAEYIQLESSGKNALDFHIAYYMGQLATASPGARIHVISKDTGFDPLLKHLIDKGILCQRSASIVEFAAPKKTAKAVSIADKVKTVIENLEKRKSAKPGTPKALRSTIKALLKNIGDEEIDRLIAELTKSRMLRIVENKVQYGEST